MINASFDIKQFSRTLKNVDQYSVGFFRGAEINKQKFNDQLGKYTVELLNKFIDSKARMEPESLHHVYEWDAAGSPSARLFFIEAKATASNILFSGKFLPSSSVSSNSSEPFINKANIMENSIAIEVSPKSSNVLAFEVNGETVFSVDSVFIANPGGDEVAGSFGRAVEDFFENYFTNVVLYQSGLFKKLSNPKEFYQNFYSGAMGGGSSLGIKSGKEYFSVKGASEIL
jgi:hypothetical protein